MVVSLVRMRGLEPPRCHHHRLLRPARLPVPPHPHETKVAHYANASVECQEYLHDSVNLLSCNAQSAIIRRFVIMVADERRPTWRATGEHPCADRSSSP